MSQLTKEIILKTIYVRIPAWDNERFNLIGKSSKNRGTSNYYFMMNYRFLFDSKIKHLDDESFRVLTYLLMECCLQANSCIKLSHIHLKDVTRYRDIRKVRTVLTRLSRLDLIEIIEDPENIIKENSIVKVEYSDSRDSLTAADIKGLVKPSTPSVSAIAKDPLIADIEEGDKNDVLANAYYKSMSPSIIKILKNSFISAASLKKIEATMAPAGNVEKSISDHKSWCIENGKDQLLQPDRKILSWILKDKFLHSNEDAILKRAEKMFEDYFSHQDLTKEEEIKFKHKCMEAARNC